MTNTEIKKPLVAVVILSWNGKSFLEQFIPDLLKTTYGNVQFYVADNASTDGTADWLKRTYPEINIIQIANNEGFAQGYNTALKNVVADYFVLLNQDVKVTPGWIEPVINLMEQSETIGACQPKLLSYNKPDEFEYAGAAGGFIDKNGYAFCRGRFFQLIEKDEGQYNQATEIVWATGACMFIRAPLFQNFGGLDGDFFAHMEEIDLCWRMKNAGYAIMYCPESVAYHVGGGSLNYGNPRKTYLNFRNNLTMIVKNLSANKVVTKTIARFILDIISAYKLLLSGHIRDYFAIIKAHVYFVAHLPGIVRKRRKVNKIVKKNSIGSPNLAGFYKGSIIWDFFINHKKRFSDLSKDLFH